MESFLAASMKPQVLTRTTEASPVSSSVQPALSSRPASSSESTSLRAQPSVTRETERRPDEPVSSAAVTRRAPLVHRRRAGAQCGGWTCSIRYWPRGGTRRSALKRISRAIAEPDHLTGLTRRTDVLAVDRHAYAAAVADQQADAFLGLPLLGLPGADDAAEQLLALGVAYVEPARALGLDPYGDVLAR